MDYSPETNTAASMEAELQKAFLRHHAWHSLFLACVLSALALLGLPLLQALVVVVPLAVLSVAVIRKHGRRSGREKAHNRR